MREAHLYIFEDGSINAVLEDEVAPQMEESIENGDIDVIRWNGSAFEQRYRGEWHVLAFDE